MVEPEFMLDANICIYILDGRSDAAAQRFERCRRGSLVTSAVAYAEVMIGAVERDKVSEANALFAQIPVLPFDQSAGEAYSRLPFKRGSYDRLIAAQAVALGLTVVTSNQKDFADVPGVKVENWTE